MDAATPSPTVTAPPPRPVPPGPTGPATMRPQSAGLKESAYPLVALMMTLGTEALKMFGPMSDEGRDLLRMMEIGSKRFGQPGADLTKQSMKLLNARANPMGTPGPENAAAMKEAMQSKMRGAGIGAAPQAPAAQPDVAPGAAA